MQEKAEARIRELAPPRPKGARRRDSRNLAFTFSCMSVDITGRGEEGRKGEGGPLEPPFIFHHFFLLAFESCLRKRFLHPFLLSSDLRQSALNQASLFLLAVLLRSFLPFHPHMQNIGTR